LLGVLPSLLSGQAVAHRGTHYSFSSPPLLPAPSAVPAFWIGGRSDAALERAAKYATGWLGLWADEDRVGQSAAKLAAFADESGRAAPRTALVIPVVVDSDARRAQTLLEQFVSSQYGLAYDRVSRWCVGGDTAAVAERLVSYRNAGVSGFVLMSAAADPLAELEALAEVRETLRAAG
jgi:alkanesulfonate monooxygenase SsuD/methylene tetrahydromethanopterin reductase-like flavin-dependent oxidoreductase (luciferase family)